MDDTLPAELTSELVAQFHDAESFAAAVDGLLAAGFDRTDLSMLGTHDSLEVAGGLAGYERDPAGSMRAGLAGETLSFLGSIALAGVLLLTAGPIGVAGAAIAAAAAGAIALRPFLGQLTELAHADGLAAAVEAGHILLWVRTNEAEVTRAEAALTEAGGVDLTRLAQPAREAPAE